MLYEVITDPVGIVFRHRRHECVHQRLIASAVPADDRLIARRGVHGLGLVGQEVKAADVAAIGLDLAAGAIV